ncbi:oxidoreductase [Mycolicibacter heraklionensis]|uniref:Oxidoreductase n=1 Tax=Mycolicibacter heraklionensis TaxID=512402 RepID=A0ABR5FAS2_9MYCO|nr:nitronate monooxygenase [Mycolicibacter heraklionensis]KLO26296.1 oxidoreductase [Mycolicibacter heraklionensis]
MSLRNRLTDYFGIEHPIVLAPMAQASGGRLAAAVTHAGGLGLLGGGYGDADWVQREFDAAGDARVGCGFITWSLSRVPEVFDLALSRRPAAIMLSFGDPEPFAEAIRDAGVPLICQVQTLEQAHAALRAGANVIVAQGAEAGGHGMSGCSTLTFVPAVVDLVAESSPETFVLAAGGIADGRGVAAALALGADGVLVGTRFWACSEAIVSGAAHQRAIRASGEDTVRTRVYDLVRQLDWPAHYDERALVNAFLQSWHGDDSHLLANLPEAIAAFQAGLSAGDFDIAHILIGEAVGLIHDVVPAGGIVAQMACDATRILNRGS